MRIDIDEKKVEGLEKYNDFDNYWMYLKIELMSIYNKDGIKGTKKILIEKYGLKIKKNEGLVCTTK